MSKARLPIDFEGKALIPVGSALQCFAGLPENLPGGSRHEPKPGLLVAQDDIPLEVLGLRVEFRELNDPVHRNSIHRADLTGSHRTFWEGIKLHPLVHGCKLVDYLCEGKDRINSRLRENRHLGVAARRRDNCG